MGKNSSKLTPNDMNDLRDQTAFSDDELRKWFRDFKEDYPNGALTMDDFKKTYGKCFPFGDATKFSEHVFRQFDSNGDGSIDFREFITALSLRNKGTLEDRLERAFTMYDIDCNGYISREEMTEIVRSIYRMVGVVDESKSVSRVEHIFGKMDRNVDGKLSLVEFIEGTKDDPAIRQLLQCDSDSLIVDSKANINV